MTFALVLLCTVAACFALRNPLKACPMAFYALSVAVDAAFVAGTAFGMPREVWSMFFILIQKCLLPLALFVVVMYIGVLPRESRPYAWLKPVRAELSIVAWILSLGHMAVYLASYLPRILAGGPFNVNVTVSFAVAAVLLVLLLLLGVTSFNFVKKRMRTESWKKLQRLAYPFFALTYVHLLLMLAPSALRGGIAAEASVAVYSIVFIGYFVLRPVRAALDRRARRAT
ncbi:ferric reductase-like transmembrane domain-containing protein [Arabiibacter massiliensis]|uniref:ferric reductase-like transmembrane domain-containing protein n=1 Tax=Arabiibacter massiliensis TaxID=1870985 RepID=UPI0009BC0DAD|nr:ferric reductase-like transmembrane domain-containing protein [Arabiibacter massiliensis]